MPISSFKTYTDIIPPTHRAFHDFTVDANDAYRANEENWVPYVDGADFLPLWFGTRSQPGFANIVRIRPGKQLNPHYHPAGVFGYTLSGSWRYLEHDWAATPGTFLWEPPGELHTLVVDPNATEPMVTYFVSLGGLVYVDNVTSGRPVAYDDGFTLLDIALGHYRSINRDPDALYKLCR
jgi:2,4'-dihydroxyacetophenone dioxygenase